MGSKTTEREDFFGPCMVEGRRGWEARGGGVKERIFCYSTPSMHLVLVGPASAGNSVQVVAVQDAVGHGDSSGRGEGGGGGAGMVSTFDSRLHCR